MMEKVTNYLAAAHILRSPFLTRKGCDQFVLNTWIDVDGLETAMGPWSATEKMMVDLALDLYDRGGHKVSVGDLATYLDSENWTIAMQALEIRRRDGR